MVIMEGVICLDRTSAIRRPQSVGLVLESVLVLLLVGDAQAP